MNSPKPEKVITRATLGAELALNGALSKNTAHRVIGELIERMAHHLFLGHPIHLNGLGRFEVVVRAARRGRNFKTGGPSFVPERLRVKFVPSKSLGREAP